MINWKVRLLNKNFWLAMVPAVALLAQAFMAIFGVELNFGATIDRVIVFVNALFVVLVLVGVVNDPTTAGLTDSNQALGYTEPKK